MSLFRQFGAILLALTASSLFSVEAQTERSLSPDAGSTQRDIKVQGPPITFNPPSADNFFQKGRRIFPKNFQSNGEPPGMPIQVTADYPVGPGDRFLINFWGRIDDALLVTIDSENNLFIPRIGAIQCKGKNYGELQKEIAARLNKSLRDVQFTISLQEARRFRVHILGSVAAPGPQWVQATMRASEVLAMAGGPSATGSAQFIEIRREDGKTQRVDLIRYLSLGDFSMNPFVSDGDLIFVPDLTDFVTIAGAVVRPGTFEIRELNDLEAVIQSMGGFSIYADRESPIKVSRQTANGGRESLMLYPAQSAHKKKGSLSQVGFKLKHGDEVFVPSGQLLIPSKSNSVFVTGEVRTPGAKPYLPSTSVEEYIGASGGLTSRANLTSAVLYKVDGSTVKVTPRVNVEPGDTIYIPERTFKFWQDHIIILTTFIGLATTVITISR